MVYIRYRVYLFLQLHCLSPCLQNQDPKWSDHFFPFFPLKMDFSLIYYVLTTVSPPSTLFSTPNSCQPQTHRTIFSKQNDVFQILHRSTVIINK